MKIKKDHYLWIIDQLYAFIAIATQYADNKENAKMQHRHGLYPIVKIETKMQD